MPEERFEKPHIIIDSGVDENVSRRINLFDKLAHEKPVALQGALLILGEAATASTISRSETNNRKTSLKRKPDELLHEFFSQRYDDEFDYDPQTVEALSNDEHFKRFRQDLTNADTSRRAVPNNKPEKVAQANALAERSRDALRRYKVLFYLRRIIRFQEPTGGELRSAS